MEFNFFFHFFKIILFPKIVEKHKPFHVEKESSCSDF